MKTLLALVLVLFSAQAFADSKVVVVKNTEKKNTNIEQTLTIDRETYEENKFRFQPHIQLEVGGQAFHEGVFGVAKVSFMSIGQKNEGVQLLGVGVLHDSEGEVFVVSPASLYSGHFIISTDVGSRIVGLSAGLSF